MATVKMYFDEKNKNSCDIYINEQGMAELIEGNEELAQELKDELESNMTQWYLGYSWGIKLLQDDGSGLFDKKSPSDEEIIQEIQRVISKHKHVLQSEITSITRYNTEDNNKEGTRHVSIEIEIITSFGKENLHVTLV